MRNIFISAFLVILAASFASAGEVAVENDGPNRLLVTIDASRPETAAVTRGGQSWDLLKISGATYTTQVGYPQVPLFHRLVALPAGKTATVRLLDSTTAPMKDLRVAPWQRSPTRGGKTYPFEINDEVYASDAQWPPEQLVVDDGLVAGGARLLSLKFHPLQIRPGARAATLTTKAQIEIRFVDSGQGGADRVSRSFRTILRDHVLNPAILRMTRDDEPAARENYLIICHDDFCDATMPLAVWKAARGLSVEVVPFSEVGSTVNDLADYLQDRYDESGLDYVLLVGDNVHIPTPSGIWGTPADHIYTTVDGDDYFADFVIGRITGDDADEIALQAAKSVAYEQAPPMIFPGWFTSSINVSGSDFDDDYNAQFCGELTETYGFDNATYYIDSLGTNLRDSAIAAINSGNSWITYFGHGSDTAWTSLNPSMINNHVLELENAGMLPVITSIACSNGAFDRNYDCFAEAWMKSGEQKGAALIFAAARDTPFFYTDELGKYLTQAYFEDGVDTYGQAALEGKLGMYDEFPEGEGSETEEVMQQFHIFGDPQLNPWSAVPASFDALETLILTRSEPAQFDLAINTSAQPVSGAVVHLYNDEIDELQTTGAGGVVSWSFDDQTDLSDVNIVVTKRNFLPLIVKLPVQYSDPTDDDADDDADDDVNDDADDDDLEIDDDTTEDQDDDDEAEPSGSDDDDDNDNGKCGLF